MNNREPILSWIQSLPEPTKCRPTRSKKRKLLHEEQQLTRSPALLEAGNENNVVSLPDRRRLERASTAQEPDATPCPFVGNILSLPETVSMASGGSGRPGTPSLLHKVASLQHAGAMEIKALDIDCLPKGAGVDSLLESICAIGRGVNILPYRMKSTVEKQIAELGGSVSLWSDAFQSPEGVDDLPGYIPTFGEVDIVVGRAQQCQLSAHKESLWKDSVHQTALNQVFAYAKQENNANSARPSQYSTYDYSSSLEVDICVYKFVERGEGLTNKIRGFCENLPTNIRIRNSYIYYHPILRPRLLLLSIWTTGRETGYYKAKLRMGVWYSEQWSFLRWAVGQRLKRRAQPEADETTPEVEAATLASLSKLGFIPGIVVHGHQWCLVLSTYDGKKTTVWEDYMFGTTSSRIGTFCAVAGVRKLTAWAEDHYWPWFEKNVL